MVTKPPKTAPKPYQRAHSHAGHAQQMQARFLQFLREFAEVVGFDREDLSAKTPSRQPENEDQEREQIDQGYRLFTRVKKPERMLDKATTQGIHVYKVKDTLGGRLIVDDPDRIIDLRNRLKTKFELQRFLDRWAEGNGTPVRIVLTGYEDRYLIPTERGHMDFKLNFVLHPKNKGWPPIEAEWQVLLSDMMPAYYVTREFYKQERGVIDRAAVRSGIDPNKWSREIGEIYLRAGQKGHGLSDQEKEHIQTLKDEERKTLREILTSEETKKIKQLKLDALFWHRRAMIEHPLSLTTLLNHPDYPNAKDHPDAFDIDRVLRQRKEEESLISANEGDVRGQQGPQRSANSLRGAATKGAAQKAHRKAASLNITPRAAKTSVSVNRPGADRKPKGP